MNRRHRHPSGSGAARRAALALLLAAAAAAAPAQVADGEILLDDLDPAGVPDYPFGITMDPDGVHAYVAVSGNYGSTLQNNRRVLKIHVLTRTILAEGQAGFFPEDVAVTTDAAGATRHVWAAASTSGTVTAFTPALVPVATIPLGGCAPYATSFPFGVAASAAGDRVFVTTLGGCGDVFVIDADPGSATFATVLHAHNIPGGHGRPLLLDPLVLVPSAVYTPGFGASQGVAAVLDPAPPPAGGPVHYTVLSPYFPGAYAAAVDAALLPNGHALLTMNGEPWSRLYEYDPVAGALVRTIALPASAGSAIHGLGVSPDGRLAVATSQDQDVLVFVDVAAGTVLATVPTGANTQPNEVAFTRDGSRIFVTLQTSPRVRVWRGLPLRDLALAAPPTVPLGGTAVFGLARGEHGQPFGLFVSAGPGPTVLGPLTVALSEPFLLLAQGTFDVAGNASIPIPVPGGPPGLSGLAFHLQAAALDRDGNLRLSPAAVVVLL